MNLKSDENKKLISELNGDWQINHDQTTITRLVKTNDFDASMSITHVAAKLAQEENHHPDICLGWGYCRISYTTHSVKTLTVLDLQSAKKLDTLLQLAISKN